LNAVASFAEFEHLFAGKKSYKIGEVYILIYDIAEAKQHENSGFKVSYYC
jgi:hypothetical protein